MFMLLPLNVGFWKKKRKECRPFLDERELFSTNRETVPRESFGGFGNVLKRKNKSRSKKEAAVFRCFYLGAQNRDL
jgi:hypothetical protein